METGQAPLTLCDGYRLRGYLYQSCMRLYELSRAYN
jgi:hypothetical protein